MDHAAAGDFEPVFAHLAGERAAEIDFEAGLGVAEVVGAKPDLDVGSQQFLEDEFDGALEVGDGDVAIDIEPFDLVERRVVGGIGVVAAVDAAGNDDADRGRLFCITRICTEEVWVRRRSGGGGGLRGGRGAGDRRYPGCRAPDDRRGVQGIETMVVILDLRAVGHGEPDLAEGTDDVLGDLRERMEFSEGSATSGQGEIDRMLGRAALSSSSARRRARAASRSVLAALMALPAAGRSSLERLPSCFMRAVNFAVGSEPCALGLFEGGDIGGGFEDRPGRTV
jgi:hypothetical protein